MTNLSRNDTDRIERLKWNVEGCRGKSDQVHETGVTRRETKRLYGWSETCPGNVGDKETYLVIGASRSLSRRKSDKVRVQSAGKSLLDPD